jgi:hypothetical protein
MQLRQCPHCTKMRCVQSPICELGPANCLLYVCGIFGLCAVGDFSRQSLHNSPCVILQAPALWAAPILMVVLPGNMECLGHAVLPTTAGGWSNQPLAL